MLAEKEWFKENSAVQWPVKHKEGIPQSYSWLHLMWRVVTKEEGLGHVEREWKSEEEEEEEEGEWCGNWVLLQLIFLKYFTWILAAVVLQKTKGNELWLPEPKTTHSVRKSCHTYCLKHRERDTHTQSQSKLLKKKKKRLGTHETHWQEN